MRTRLVLAAATIALSAISASAGSLTIRVLPNATPISDAAPYPYFGRAYGFSHPACPYRYHWECWADPSGEGCGCRPDAGLYIGW